MSRFGTPTQKTSTSKFSTPSAKQDKPFFQKPAEKAANPFFKAPTEDNDTSLFGTPTAVESSGRFGPPSDPSKQTGKDGSGFLLFDNEDHSGDSGGQSMAGRGTRDESANVFKEIEALGYDITTTDATDAATLETLLADVATFILPEAEGGNEFPDGDTVFSFVESGGNLLFFGGTNVPGTQLNYINDTFGVHLDGDAEYTRPQETQTRNDAALGADDDLLSFLTGSETLAYNAGTSNLHVDTLPEGATPLYISDDDESVLVTMPVDQGQVIFVGWSFYSSFNQDGGWDEAFATVADLTAETEGVIVGLSRFGQPNAVDAGDLFQGA